MNLSTTVNEMDAMVAQGAIVDAVKAYFANNASTSDFSGVTTSNKAQMVEKMEGFAGAIAKVNGITLHGTTLSGNRSASEFTFDFDMADNTKIYWHEIIRRVWNDEGKVVEEAYFKA